MFKRSLAFLLGVLMAFSFAMVASAEAIDYGYDYYAPAQAEVEIQAVAEAEFVPMSDANDDEWDRMLWFIYVPELGVQLSDGWCFFVAIVAWPLNFIGINLGNFSAWLTDVGAVDGIGTLISWAAGLAVFVTIAIAFYNIILSLFGAD
ncbi:MAG: hypothetical protein FWE40_05580 [Oscillospiraceae bacterium]|nr:hypothetical protein [Oscillospiraceae bacterium]